MILLDTSQTAVIPVGSFESNPVGLGKSGTLEAITMPVSWTDSDITFKVAVSEDATYYPMHDANGEKITIRKPTGSLFISLNSRVTRGMRFFKLVSEKVQGEERSITLHISASI
jgi:hypothetical protein